MGFARAHANDGRVGRMTLTGGTSLPRWSEPTLCFEAADRQDPWLHIINTSVVIALFDNGLA